MNGMTTAPAHAARRKRYDLGLRPILGLLAELTLVMILFYSGLDMVLESLIRGGAVVGSCPTT